jgi:hypothetical protein
MFVIDPAILHGKWKDVFPSEGAMKDFLPCNQPTELSKAEPIRNELTECR